MLQNILITIIDKIMHNNHQFIKNKGEEIIFIHKSINNYKMDLYDKLW